MKNFNYSTFPKWILILSFFFPLLSVAQKTSNEYWDAILKANVLYDDAKYTEAVEAYKIAFQMPNEDEMANHRLNAAASNCMIDNEAGVREHLFVLLKASSKRDMNRVRVNYEIFNKYKQTDWWKELDKKMDERLEALIAHHKNLTIFKHGRNIKYSAIRINKEGDTVANTFIHMIPDGTGWGDEAATLQSQVIFKYEYTTQDSLDHIGELEKIVETRFWEKLDTTGVIENKNRIWMHPFRSNEFFKTEIAPFPAVRFPISDESIQKANSKTVIIRNWGTYSPSETELTYNYIGKEKRNYTFQDNLICHKFKAIGINNAHGTSEIEYYFHEGLGFTEMIYFTYDGDTIIFEMKEIYNK